MAAVTGEQCDKRHSRLWIAIKAGGAILTLLVALIGIFSTIAYRASAKAEEADKTATKVQTEVSTALPYIQRGIDDIKIEQAAQRKMLTELSK